MATEVDSRQIVELLTRLLARRTGPGRSHLVLSEADYETTLSQLLDMTDTADETQWAVLSHLRNQLVHAEFSTSATWLLMTMLQHSEPESRQAAAMVWAESAAAGLAEESLQWRTRFEEVERQNIRWQIEGSEGEVVAAIADSFLEHLTEKGSLGKLDTDEAVRLGRRAADQVWAASRWSQIVGDRLNTTQVAALLGVSRQALAKRQATGSLLGLSGDGTTWYPTWQFDIEAARIRPEVRDLIGAFRDRLDKVDPLVIAAWATTPQKEDLAGETPAQWLSAGRDHDRLRQAAERAAARLAR